ncbi:hypothetical protein XNA1_4030001 [Xenorhabdus nematophila str. Anatoliense]|nr:hypothetical protein XNA1_4030001 [Xenorhabdus nematophila str. Anatoliense]
MRNQQLKKIRQELDTLGLIEKDPDMVGYILFNRTRNTHSNRFATQGASIL